MRNVCCKVNTMREEKGDQERVKFLLMNISVSKSRDSGDGLKVRQERVEVRRLGLNVRHMGF